MAKLWSPGAVDAYGKIADKTDCFPLLLTAVAWDVPWWRADQNWCPTLPPAVAGAYGLDLLHLNCISGATAEDRQTEIVGMDSGGIYNVPQSPNGPRE